MEQYRVTGMSCAACSARVEKAVSAVPGVTACSVSLLTNSMGVEGSASPGEIIRAVEEAGYGASLKRTEGNQADSAAAGDEEALQDRETPILKKRLIASVILLIPLLYLSMGHMMWGWPLPKWFDGNHVAMGLVQLVLTGLIMVINQRFFISGFRALLHRAPNMDTLVALGASAAFLWSLCVLFVMTRAVVDGDEETVMRCMMDFYFESAAFAVKPGESIPVDGVVLEGMSAVNEAALTGESIPVDKAEGDRVSAATINQSGYLRCEATRVGEDTTLSQIIRMVSDAAATKAPIARIADKVSGVFVPVVIGIAVVTVAVWLTLGESMSFALARGISVLVISCPCALGLATPVAIMVGNGVGAKNGILFKTSESLEETGRVRIVALDKTGTVTQGEPEVTDLLPAEGIDERALLKLAASVEQRSEHPLAKAILRLAEARGIVPSEVSAFTALPGRGIAAVLDGEAVQGGSMQFIAGQIAIPDTLAGQVQDLAEAGKTPLLFARGGRMAGIVAVADVIKAESPQAVRELRNMGIRVVMLTGDNPRTAAAIGRQAGVEDVIAGVLPDGKEAVIRALGEKGRVAMVGDGINDAPALTRADIGIAIGAGADVAVDAADVVLMKNRLTDVPAAIRLSRATLRNIRQNLFWAFIYNSIGIPLAAGCFIRLFGWTLNPMFGAAAMSLSSFSVVSNALRLNWFRLYDAGRDRKAEEADISDVLARFRVKDSEAASPPGTELRLEIEGMMCEHCEARVAKALEKLPGVLSASADWQTGIAVLWVSQPPELAAIKQALEEEDYLLKGLASDGTGKASAGEDTDANSGLTNSAV